MKRMITLAALLAAGLMLAPASVRAQDNTTRRQDRQERQVDFTALTDAQMLQMAAYSGLMEVTLSDEAEERADNNDANKAIETFAETMVKHHNEANEDLVKLAENKHIDLKQTLPERMKQQFDRMHAIEDDNAFLREYVTQQVRAHERSVKLFEAISEHADDEDVRAFGAKYLPTIRKHLEMARDLAGTNRTPR